MTTLMPCRTCGKEISINAKTCPHCGEPEPFAHEPATFKEATYELLFRFAKVVFPWAVLILVIWLVFAI